MPYYVPETFTQKLKRKCKEEPLVPIGMALTVFALFKGVSAFRSGDQKTSQQMMRWRVAAQGFTLIAATAGMLYYSKPKPDPNAIPANAVPLFPPTTTTSSSSSNPPSA
ncbi:Respiratory supercomplex factor 1, mitochondrial [Allomyces arbusculus]|nr:Respiratory supercomplex factor 1, mitochondrial [Allomyces arbusculus]